MKIYQQNKIHVISFSVFAAIILLLFVYAGSTGWIFFNNDNNQQTWSRSGPGYHK